MFDSHQGWRKDRWISGNVSTLEKCHKMQTVARVHCQTTDFPKPININAKSKSPPFKIKKMQMLLIKPNIYTEIRFCRLPWGDVYGPCRLIAYLLSSLVSLDFPAKLSQTPFCFCCDYLKPRLRFSEWRGREVSGRKMEGKKTMRGSFWRPWSHKLKYSWSSREHLLYPGPARRITRSRMFSIQV